VIVISMHHRHTSIDLIQMLFMTVIVAARPTRRNTFACANNGIVVSNHGQGHIYVCGFVLDYVILCR
jgi:hypothetical protein